MPPHLMSRVKVNANTGKNFVTRKFQRLPKTGSPKEQPKHLHKVLLKKKVPPEISGKEAFIDPADTWWMPLIFHVSQINMLLFKECQSTGRKTNGVESWKSLKRSCFMFMLPAGTLRSPGTFSLIDPVTYSQAELWAMLRSDPKSFFDAPVFFFHFIHLLFPPKPPFYWDTTDKKNCVYLKCAIWWFDIHLSWE